MMNFGEYKMFNLVLKPTLMILITLLTLPVHAKSSCYEVKALSSIEPYSLSFSEGTALIPIKSNGNYYMRVQAGREFGCVVFAGSWTKGVLKGAYKAVEAERLVSKCEGKKDYVYTQFVDQDNKKIFRLQCEKAVYEDQLPEPFSPNIEQVKKIDFGQSVTVSN